MGKNCYPFLYYRVDGAEVGETMQHVPMCVQHFSLNVAVQSLYLYILVGGSQKSQFRDAIYLYIHYGLTD